MAPPRVKLLNWLAGAVRELQQEVKNLKSVHVQEKKTILLAEVLPAPLVLRADAAEYIPGHVPPDPWLVLQRLCNEVLAEFDALHAQVGANYCCDAQPGLNVMDIDSFIAFLNASPEVTSNKTLDNLATSSTLNAEDGKSLQSGDAENFGVRFSDSVNLSDAELEVDDCFDSENSIPDALDEDAALLLWDLVPNAEKRIPNGVDELIFIKFYGNILQRMINLQSASGSMPMSWCSRAGVATCSLLNCHWEFVQEYAQDAVATEVMLRNLVRECSRLVASDAE